MAGCGSQPVFCDDRAGMHVVGSTCLPRCKFMANARKGTKGTCSAKLCLVTEVHSFLGFCSCAFAIDHYIFPGYAPALFVKLFALDLLFCSRCWPLTPFLTTLPSPPLACCISQHSAGDNHWVCSWLCFYCFSAASAYPWQFWGPQLEDFPAAMSTPSCMD